MTEHIATQHATLNIEPAPHHTNIIIETHGGRWDGATLDLTLTPTEAELIGHLLIESATIVREQEQADA